MNAESVSGKESANIPSTEAAGEKGKRSCSLERAKQIMGEDFYGPEAISVLEKEINQAREDLKEKRIRFVLLNQSNIRNILKGDEVPPEIPFSEEELQKVKKNKGMLFLHPWGVRRLAGFFSFSEVLGLGALVDIVPDTLCDFSNMTPDRGRFFQWFRSTPHFSVKDVLREYQRGRGPSGPQIEIRPGWFLVYKKPWRKITDAKYEDAKRELEYGEGSQREIQARLRNITEFIFDELLIFSRTKKIPRSQPLELVSCARHDVFWGIGLTSGGFFAEPVYDGLPEHAVIIRPKYFSK